MKEDFTMNAVDPTKRRQRYAQLTDEEKAELLERNRQWREQWKKDHPEEYEQQKRDRAARITAKYQNDEEYRAHRQEYLRLRYAQLTPEEREKRRQAQKESYRRRKANKIVAAEKLKEAEEG